jgi:acyl-CoA synthetase (AMP-forming)/AMP-acid ligase II
VNPATTIPEALAAAAAEDAGMFRFHLEEGPVPVSFPELAERADRAARRLVARGVRPGDVVGVLGPNRPEWLVWAYATWIAGAAVAPIQIPLRIRRPDAFAEQLLTLVRAAGCGLVLADPRLAALLPDGVGVPWEERGEESGEKPVGPAPESTAVIQFTSGSTARPKGVVVTQAAVIAQLRLLYRHYFKEGVSQTTVGWVPFFHDLGLITTAIFPPFARSTVELLPTERFAADPAEWLRLIERTRGLGTLAPSSAFGSAIRAAERRRERIDIGSLIVAHFAAEGVDPEVAERMAEVGTRKFGLRPDALGSTYGLAEAVLGVSYSEMGAGMRVDRVSVAELGEGRAVPAAGGPERKMVSCGKPVMELRIAAPDLSPLPEREVGEILVRGPSLASGYLGADVPDPFVDGWLRSGDLGYLADGELYVAGRAKDMVIAMGQNYYPEDFEWAAGRVSGVRAGRCVAFAKPGSEQVVVLVEPSEADADAAALGREVRRSVADAVGVPPGEVLVVPRDTVQKTTSGKLRRAAMLERYAAGGLGPAGAEAPAVGTGAR